MRRWLEPPWLICLFTIAVWLPALACGFVFDDLYLVEQQTCFRSLSSIPGFFMDPYDACDYRPMRYVTYAIDYAIAGTSPWIYHLTNVLFHAGSAVILWFIVAAVHRRQGREVGLVAMVCVTLWAVHPVLADAVVPVAGRRDVQCTFFYLLCVLLVLERDRGRTWLYFVGAAVSFILALLTKEMAVTAPIVAGLVDVVTRRHPLGARARKALLLVGGLGLLIAIGFTWYRAVYLTHSNMSGRWWGGTPLTNLWTVLGLQVEYARLVFFPLRLIGDYSFGTVPIESALGARVLLGAGIVCTWLVAVVVSWRRAPVVAAGLAWSALALAPVCHIFPHHELMAEHYLHLPPVGVALALSAVPNSRGAVGALAIVLVLMVVRVEVRIPDYESDGSFGWSIAEHAPGNARNFGRLADFYLDPQRGNDSELGAGLAWQGIWTSREGSRAEVSAALRLARVLDEQGDSPGAAILIDSVRMHNAGESLRRALAVRYVDAGDCVRARSILGGLVAQTGRATYVAMQGACSLREGVVEDAGVYAAKSLAIEPTADGFFLQGNVRYESGQVGPALKAWDQALALNPDLVDALRVSARVLCPVHPAEARRRLAHAASLVPRDGEVLLAICPEQK